MLHTNAGLDARGGATGGRHLVVITGGNRQVLADADELVLLPKRTTGEPT
jgi:hypothetical protein